MKWVLRDRLAQWAKAKRQERGTTTVVAALGMMVFMLCAGYAVDLSHLYLAGTELQNAADASAIAAASELNGFGSGITAAVDAALATQNRYEFSQEVATFTRADVKFAVNLSDFANGGGYSETGAQGVASRIRFVNVLIRDKPIPVPFIGAVLTLDSSGTSSTYGTTAVNQTATTASDGSTTGGTATNEGSSTFLLSRQAISGFSAGLNVLCDSIVPLSVVQDDQTHAPLDVDESCPNQWAFTPGCKYIVRRGSNGNGHGSVEAGNYLILALAGRGGDDAREGVAGGARGCFKPGDIVETKPGVTAGPVRQGLNTRFGDYSGGLSATDFPPDNNVKEDITYAQYRSGLAAYQQAPGVTGRDGRRIIIIPVVNKGEYDNGRDTVKIYKFAAFFLQKRVDGGNGGDIWAEYITMKVQVTDGYITGGDGDTQFSIPVLYR